MLPQILRAIAQSWRDSLALFLPKNLKLFCLVTLNACIQTATVFFKYWSWLIAIDIVLYLFFVWMGPLIDNHLGNFGERFFLIWIFCVVPLCLYFFLMLSLRPSIMHKDYDYFFSYLRVFPQFLLFNIISVALLTVGFMIQGIPYVWVVLPALLINFYSFFITGVFFLLDSDGSMISFFKSFSNAFKMIIYNYPFYCISYAIFSFIFYISNYIFSPVNPFVAYSESTTSVIGLMGILLLLYYFIFSLIYLCWFNNFYIKRVHDQFNLYI